MTANTVKAAKPVEQRVLDRAVVRKVIKLNRRNRATEERVVLFTVPDENGVDQEFSIPAKVSAGVSLKMIRIFRTDGEMSAIAAMLEDMLGIEGYQALEESDVDQETFGEIVNLVQEIVMGVTEAGKDAPTED